MSFYKISKLFCFPFFWYFQPVQFSIIFYIKNILHFKIPPFILYIFIILIKYSCYLNFLLLKFLNNDIIHLILINCIIRRHYMKKKIFILCVAVWLISIFYRLLVRKNQKLIPINMRFFRPNGSLVNIRTIIPEPGK